MSFTYGSNYWYGRFFGALRCILESRWSSTPVKVRVWFSSPYSPPPFTPIFFIVSFVPWVDLGFFVSKISLPFPPPPPVTEIVQPRAASAGRRASPREEGWSLVWSLLPGLCLFLKCLANIEFLFLFVVVFTLSSVSLPLALFAFCFQPSCIFLIFIQQMFCCCYCFTPSSPRAATSNITTTSSRRYVLLLDLY